MKIVAIEPNGNLAFYLQQHKHILLGKVSSDAIPFSYFDFDNQLQCASTRSVSFNRQTTKWNYVTSFLFSLFPFGKFQVYNNRKVSRCRFSIVRARNGHGPDCFKLDFLWDHWNSIRTFSVRLDQPIKRVHNLKFQLLCGKDRRKLCWQSRRNFQMI